MACQQLTHPVPSSVARTRAIRLENLSLLAYTFLMDTGGALSDYVPLQARTSTFASIDVVGSTGLKAGQNEQDIIYTFLSYHKVVSTLAYAQHGEVIHITGDGMMCRFQRAEDASSFVRALLGELTPFNKKQNRLAQPFGLRVGVHTGEVMESKEMSGGQLISQTLDITAKLQQSAPTNHAYFSEKTVGLLKTEAAQFEKVGWNTLLQMNVFLYREQTDTRPSGRTLPNPARILVVEEELDELIDFKRFLKERQRDTLMTYTQNQARIACAAWKPHVIVLSLDLPWETGWEFLTGLRSDDQWSPVPIIAMSRQATGDTVQKSFKLGANGFLRKPLDDQQVVKRIEMVLREFYL